MISPIDYLMEYRTTLEQSQISRKFCFLSSNLRDLKAGEMTNFSSPENQRNWYDSCTDHSLLQRRLSAKALCCAWNQPYDEKLLILLCCTEQWSCVIKRVFSCLMVASGDEQCPLKCCNSSAQRQLHLSLSSGRSRLRRICSSRVLGWIFPTWRSLGVNQNCQLLCKLELELP